LYFILACFRFIKHIPEMDGPGREEIYLKVNYLFKLIPFNKRNKIRKQLKSQYLNITGF